MADDVTLPGIGDAVETQQNADGSIGRWLPLLKRRSIKTRCCGCSRGSRRRSTRDGPYACAD